MLENNIYKRSPVILQNLFITGRGLLYSSLRQGRAFRKISSELEKTQHFNDLELREWQDKKLNLLIQHAYKNVPYYGSLFKKLKITPDDIRNIDDFRKLPLLSKEDVRNYSNDLLDRNANKAFLNWDFTSGTSGKPLRFYRDLYSINFENAVLWRQKKWGGISPYDRIAVLRDEQVVPFNVKKAPFWRYSAPERKIFLSAYHISKENTLDYVRAIEDFKPKAIEAVASSLYILSKFIKEKGISLRAASIKAIFTSSEILLPEHRDLIEEVFNARIYDYYGSTERAAAIHMCEQGAYHVVPEYGIAEFLPLDDESGKLELVGTGLHNYAMPLLRYRTGDIVQLSGRDCECGRRFEVAERIEGRLSDFFTLRDGRIISEVYFILQGLQDTIKESQIIQEDFDRIRLKFVPINGFCKKDENRIMANVRKYFGAGTELILDRRDALIDNSAVKFRPFISYVNKGNI